MKNIRNSSLRIAAILGDRLFEGIRFEGELLPLTPTRVNAVLEFCQPDILLVESVSRSCDGFWNTSASAEPAQQEALARVVKTAIAKRVPTIFWLTVGQEKLMEYQKNADLFDLIACADPRAASQFVKEGKNAVYLPPCVQPAIFNPFRYLDAQGADDLNILFEKGGDLQKFDVVRSAIEGLNRHGLTILESRSTQGDESMSVSDNAYDSLSFAFVTPGTRLAVLKNAKAYASCEISTSSWVEQQWMVLEAAACRMAVVHLGRLEVNDLLSNVVINCSCEEDFLLEFYRHSKDSFYQERIAHSAWRHVNEYHTFSHRIAQLCRELSLAHDWVEYPKVSVITPTIRKELLKTCIDNYEAFNYPDKELVVVFNGDELPNADDMGLSARKDITVTFVPSDLFAGAALNMGNLSASGKYVFRVDDDDYYGKNYLKDMVFGVRAINADLFGKYPVPLKFEGSEEIYVKESSKEFIILKPSDIPRGNVWLGGNTVAGTAEFFNSNPYLDCVYGAADSSMQLNINYADTPCIALFDKFNVVAFRKADINLHTWRDSPAQLIKKRLALLDFREYLI